MAVVGECSSNPHEPGDLESIRQRPDSELSLLQLARKFALTTDGEMFDIRYVAKQRLAPAARFVRLTLCVGHRSMAKLCRLRFPDIPADFVNIRPATRADIVSCMCSGKKVCMLAYDRSANNEPCLKGGDKYVLHCSLVCSACLPLFLVSCLPVLRPWSGILIHGSSCLWQGALDVDYWNTGQGT